MPVSLNEELGMKLLIKAIENLFRYGKKRNLILYENNGA